MHTMSTLLNAPFPDFELQDQDGQTHRLSDLKGAPAVIYFYPKDDTSGCTTQACGVRDALPGFPEGARVFGVSPDDVKSHRKFVDKYSLNFPLLADTEHLLAEQAGVWVEKSMYGKKYMGVERSTFVLDSEGVVRHEFRKVKPAEHAEMVRQALESL
jgi:thioredoxin-dependent peroxiredoxin